MYISLDNPKLVAKYGHMQYSVISSVVEVLSHLDLAGDSRYDTWKTEYLNKNKLNVVKEIKEQYCIGLLEAKILCEIEFENLMR